MPSDVVIIEDENALAELVKLNLSLRGISIKAAYSGEEGIDLIKCERPSLVLLDILLPDINGWEVCRRLKTAHNLWIPSVVFLSAAAQVSDKEKACEAGGDGFLLKPFEMQELLLTVQRFVKRKT